ncbi:hypothetical protein [Stieleria varia]|uniref:Uncharacterized protein n=2 Tax=Stieleria varia TaxID=2528005 RepID=A0A5C6B2W4_9BACT|nr:hypothetical protein [Stieleria varia]TWU06230.1 hypothetical protein Pla52n_19500 [Stieleria varia]
MNEEQNFLDRRSAYRLGCVVFVVILLAMFGSMIFFQDRALKQLHWGIVYFTTYSSVSAIAGALLVWGGSHLIRLAALFVSPLIGWYACLVAGDSSSFLFHVFTYSIICVVVVTGWSMRFWFGEMRVVGRDDPVNEALRFSIRDLMIWTAVAAIAAPIVKWLWDWFPGFGRLRGTEMVIGLGLMFAVATLLNVWCFLGRRVSALRVSVVAVGVALTAGGIRLLSPEVVFASSIASDEVVFATFALLLRGAGVRFVKRGSDD